MKTKVRKSNRSKKAAKVRRSSRAADARVGHGTEPWWFLESPEEWTKLRGKWKLRDLLALLSLGLNPNDVTPKINRRKRKAGFTKPAALPVADAVGDNHPCFTWADASKLGQLEDNFAMLSYSYSRLLASLRTSHAKLEARVAVAESRLDSLLHDQPQVANIDKSSVAASGASGPATPLYKVSCDLPADLPWGSDAPLTKEGSKRIPRIVSTIKGEGAIGVTLCDEPNDPLFEALVLGLKFTPAELDLGSSVPEPSRFTRLVRQCVAQARRVLHAAAKFVAEL